MLSLKTAYRDTLSACFATKWRLAGLLAAYTVLTSIIWITYFKVAYAILSHTVQNPADAAFISNIWGQKPLSALLFTSMVATVGLVFLAYLDDGRKSAWDSIKLLAKRWRALITVSSAFALLSIANFYVLTNLGDLSLGLMVVDTIFYVLKYLCLLVLLSAVTMGVTLPAQLSSLLSSSKATWPRTLAQLLLLAIFFKAFAFAYGWVDNQILDGTLIQLYRIPLFIADTVLSNVVPVIVLATLVHANRQGAARHKPVAEVFS